MKNFTQKFIGLLALVFAMSSTVNAQDCIPVTSSSIEDSDFISWAIIDCNEGIIMGGGPGFQGCINIPDNCTVLMYDSDGNGWNGAVLMIGDDVFTLDDGYEGLASIGAGCDDVFGCMDESALNYNPEATVEYNGLCVVGFECPAGQVEDCDGSGACVDQSWIGDGYGDCEDQQYGADLTCYDNDGGDCDGWILYEIYGCMDELASNYNPDANTDDGLCEYPFLGCTDENAENYNSEAIEDDGLCEYPPNCTYDVFADGSINVSDIVATMNAILNNVPDVYGYNCDGILNILDIHGTVQTILGNPITHNDGGLIYANSYLGGIEISSENGSLYGLQISFDSIIEEDEVVYIEDNLSLPNHMIVTGGNHILIFSIIGTPLPENFSILFPLSMQMNITNIIASNYDAGSMYVNTSLEGCTDDNGVFYDEGVQWSTDPCTLCSCEDGEIFCSTVDCAIPECEAPNYLDDVSGECCPVCIEVDPVSDCEQQDIPLDLPQGWSMFGYTCLESVDVIEAFAYFSESINIVKDYLGNAYLPSWSFNAIGELQFARGYQIKMIETVEDFQFCTTPSIMQGASQEELDAAYDNGYGDGFASVDITSDNADVAAEAYAEGAASVTPADVDAAYADGVASVDITSDNQAAFDEGAASVTPEDGVSQSDVDAANVAAADAAAVLQASLDAAMANQEDGVTQADVDAVQSQLEAANQTISELQGDPGLNYPPGDDGWYWANVEGCLNGLAYECANAAEYLANYNAPQYNIAYEISSCVNVTEMGWDLYYASQYSCTEAIDYPELLAEFFGADYCTIDSDSDGVCDQEEVVGCQDESAFNFNPLATDSGNCIPKIYGCLYLTACNYNSEANTDDGSCVFPTNNLNCSGNTIQIGDYYQGGIVFQINDDGTGLVAAPEVQAPVGSSTTMGGNGSVNYEDAMEFASSLVEQGYDDWFLPNLSQLQLMLSTIGAEGNIYGFESIWYWSSEIAGPDPDCNNCYSVWTCHPYNNSTFALFYGSNSAFRTIRAF